MISFWLVHYLSEEFYAGMSTAMQSMLRGSRKFAISPEFQESFVEGEMPLYPVRSYDIS